LSDSRVFKNRLRVFQGCRISFLIDPGICVCLFVELIPSQVVFFLASFLVFRNTTEGFVAPWDEKIYHRQFFESLLASISHPPSYSSVLRVIQPAKFLFLVSGIYTTCPH